jgi:hypothetical protein
MDEFEENSKGVQWPASKGKGGVCGGMCVDDEDSNLHCASWEDSGHSKGERTMKVKAKSCC